MVAASPLISHYSSQTTTHHTTHFTSSSQHHTLISHHSLRRQSSHTTHYTVTLLITPLTSHCFISHRLFQTTIHHTITPIMTTLSLPHLTTTPFITQRSQPSHFFCCERLAASMARSLHCIEPYLCTTSRLAPWTRGESNRGQLSASGLKAIHCAANYLTSFIRPLRHSPSTHAAEVINHVHPISSTHVLWRQINTFVFSQSHC